MRTPISPWPICNYLCRSAAARSWRRSSNGRSAVEYCSRMVVVTTASVKSNDSFKIQTNNIFLFVDLLELQTFAFRCRLQIVLLITYLPSSNKPSSSIASCSMDEKRLYSVISNYMRLVFSGSLASGHRSLLMTCCENSTLTTSLVVGRS